MRECKLDNGNIVHLPEAAQRYAENCYCSCHVRMGNDFYFLPIGSCLRPDNTCDHPKGQSLEHT